MTKICYYMKVLSLGLDNSVLNKFSALAKRVVGYGELVEKYTVIVPNQINEAVELSEKVKVYGSSGGNKLRQFIKIYKLANKLCSEKEYDIITVQDQYYLALIGLYLSKKAKIGLEIQVHGFEKYYGFRKIIAKYVLPRAGAVRCVSQRLKQELINDFGVKEKNITVAPIYSEPLINNRQPIKPDKNKFIFLTAGRLAPVKNIGLQIEAMDKIVKRYPDSQLWIIGDGPEKKNYEFKIADFELEKNIKLFGWKDNLEKYYSAADCFVLTSNYEGWGLAIVEAAGLALPIIMTDVGCAGEFIKDGESGLIIPVNNKQSLIEAMLKIMADENLRKRLRKNAKSAAARLLNKEQTFNLYKISWQKAVLIS